MNISAYLKYNANSTVFINIQYLQLRDYFNKACAKELRIFHYRKSTEILFLTSLFYYQCRLECECRKMNKQPSINLLHVWSKLVVL